MLTNAFSGGRPCSARFSAAATGAPRDAEEMAELGRLLLGVAGAVVRPPFRSFVCRGDAAMADMGRVVAGRATTTVSSMMQGAGKR